MSRCFNICARRIKKLGDSVLALIEQDVRRYSLFERKRRRVDVNLKLPSAINQVIYLTSASIRVVTLPPPLQTAVSAPQIRNSIGSVGLYLHLLGNMRCQSEQ